MKNKRFIKNLVFYFLANFSTKLLSILFIPVYTIYVNATDFGYFSLTLSTMYLVIPILYQSIWEGTFRFAIENDGILYKQKKVFSTTFYYCFGISIIYSIIFLIYVQKFSILYGIAILVMGLSQMCVSYWQFTARALQKNKTYTIATVVSSIATIITNIILIMIYKWGLIALFIANIMGGLAMVIVLELHVKLLKTVKLSAFSVEILKSILKYSFPLAINAISWWLIDSSNSLIISYRIGLNQNGVYAMASRFGSIMVIVTSVINMAWLEESFRTHNDRNKDENFNKILDIIIRLILSGVVLLIPITYIVYRLLVFREYSEGIVLVPIIYLSIAYSVFASHLGSEFLARKESNIIFISTLFGGIVSAGGGYLLAKPFGVIGVVGTTFIGYLTMCLIRIPMLKKRMNIVINYFNVIIMTSLCLGIMAISYLLKDNLRYQFLILIFSIALVIIINKSLVTTIFMKFKNMNKIFIK